MDVKFLLVVCLFWCYPLMISIVQAAMTNEIKLTVADGIEPDGSICPNASTITLHCSFPDTRTVINGIQVYALSQPVWSEDDIDLRPNGDIFTLLPVNSTFEMLQLNIKDYRPHFYNTSRSYRCSLVYTRDVNTRLHSERVNISDKFPKLKCSTQIANSSSFLDMNPIAKWKVNEEPPLCYDVLYRITLSLTPNSENTTYNTSNTQMDIPNLKFSTIYHLEVIAMSSIDSTLHSEKIVHKLQTPCFCEQNVYFCTIIIAICVVIMAVIIGVPCCVICCCCHKRWKSGNCSILPLAQKNSNGEEVYIQEEQDQASPEISTPVPATGGSSDSPQLHPTKETVLTDPPLEPDEVGEERETQQSVSTRLLNTIPSTKQREKKSLDTQLSKRHGTAGYFVSEHDPHVPTDQTAGLFKCVHGRDHLMAC